MKRSDWESFANKVTELAYEYDITADWLLDCDLGYYFLNTDVHEPDYKEENDKDGYEVDADDYLTDD